MEKKLKLLFVTAARVPIQKLIDKHKATIDTIC